MGSHEDSARPVGHPVAVLESDVDRCVVWLRGEHDISTEAELRGLLARAIGLGGSTVVVDLGQVQFMDASTVRVIADASNTLQSSGRALTVRSATGRALRLINLCRLHNLIDRREVAPSS
jgi:anti-anti-sigma factor